GGNAAGMEELGAAQPGVVGQGCGEIGKRGHLPDLREYVLGKRVDQQILEVWLPDLPSAATNVIAEFEANGFRPGKQRLHEAPDAEGVLVAGAVEEHAAHEMPDRPDEEVSPDQHQIAALLQDRPEVALDVGGTRAGPAGALFADDRLQ